MRWHLITLFLIIICRLMSLKKDEFAQFRKQEETKLVYFVNQSSKVIEFLNNMLENYFIWLFHCYFATLLFANQMNFTTIILYFLEAIIFSVQLFQWLKKKEDVWEQLRRSWQVLYYAILISSGYKFVSLFARYVIVKRLYFGMLDALVPERFQIIFLDRRDNSSDYVFSAFRIDTVIICMAFFANHCMNSRKEAGHRRDTKTIISNNLSSIDGGENNGLSALMTRHTTSFTTGLLIFKGMTFIFMGYHATMQSNAYKVVLMLVPLIYFNTLFVKIEKAMQEYKLRDLLEFCRLV